MEPGAQPVVEVIPPYFKRNKKKSGKGRKIVWGALLFLVVFGAAGAGAAYQLDLYKPVLDRYNAASISIKVKEGDKYALEGAKIVLNGNEYVTDQNGRAVLAGIVAGTYEITVSKDGYQDAKVTVTLQRGDNDVQYVSLAKLPDKTYAVKGFVQDYVTGKPVADVSVTLGSKTVRTDPAGAYAFEKVAPAEVKLSLSKADYLSKELPLKVADQDLITAKVPLVPTGRTVFVSNRDGKRNLYSANYDGSDQRLFVEAKDGGEDYAPLTAPDTASVVFSSSRDGVKGPDGSTLLRLYVATGDGKTVTRVAEDVNASFDTVTWSPNGRYLYFSGYSNGGLTQGTYKVYGLDGGTLTDLGEAALATAFSPDSNSLAYQVATYEDRPTDTVQPDGTTVTTVKRTYVTMLKTINLKSGERKTLAKREEGMSNLAFSADGKSVAYEATIENVRKRFQVSLADGAEVEIALQSADKRTYAVSPDGKHKAFIETRDGKSDLFAVDAAGKNEVRLSTLGSVHPGWLPVWNASGTFVTFAIKREAETALYVVPASGGEAKKIVDYYEPGSSRTY